MPAKTRPLYLSQVLEGIARLCTQRTKDDVLNIRITCRSALRFDVSCTEREFPIGLRASKVRPVLVPTTERTSPDTQKAFFHLCDTPEAAGGALHLIDCGGRDLELIIEPYGGTKITIMPSADDRDPDQQPTTPYDI